MVPHLDGQADVEAFGQTLSLVHDDLRIQEDQGLEEEAARVGEDADSGAQMVDLCDPSDGARILLGQSL